MTDEKPQSTTLSAIEIKAAVLMVLFFVLLAGSAVYLMVARGVFDESQTLVLEASDSEGVSVGMSLTFSGFPIGRVRRIDLVKTGNVHITIDVPKKDAHWLRSSSIFTMERGLVGGTRLRAFSGVLDDPPLPNGALRQALQGDALAELPQIVAKIREVIDNVDAMTGSDSALNATLGEFQTMAKRLNSNEGVLGVLAGNAADRARIMSLLTRLDAVAARAEGLVARAESLVGNADRRVFGDDGLMTDAQTLLRQVNSTLSEARESLKTVDAILLDAKTISGNVSDASVDLGALRAQVEASLRKVESLVNDINRRWPFARDTEVQLP